MSRRFALIAIGAICLMTSSAFGLTRAQCAHEYDKCKQRPENIFDKGPCKKERAACDLMAARSVQDSTKNRMLNGQKAEPQMTSKEAARRRLAERNGEVTATVEEMSMRDRLNSAPAANTPEGRKAEALRRMKERQRAQTAPAPANGGSMRDSLKSN